MARSLVAAARCRAAATMCGELSARIGGLLRPVGFEFGDHPVEVGQDLFVHLGHPLVAAALGVVDERQRPLPLGLELGQELRSGEEDWAGQAGFSELGAGLSKASDL
ncbi:hypothetical protein [Kitasatospora sp. NPDC087314]|uniref:hypothetical protein n=1 Tax=Kitasatospora sp. NPDC087314 TaxID=3364068 RepID=UPI0037F49C4F